MESLLTVVAAAIADLKSLRSVCVSVNVRAEAVREVLNICQASGFIIIICNTLAAFNAGNRSGGWGLQGVQICGLSSARWRGGEGCVRFHQKIRRNPNCLCAILTHRVRNNRDEHTTVGTEHATA